MEIQEVIVFNGVKYKLMGTKRYYLSQSNTNKGRKNPKGLHVAIWEFYSGKKVPKGYVVHHKDHNSLNNDFSNLECVSREQHWEMHKEDFHKWAKSDESKKHLSEIREKASAWHKSEVGKNWHKKMVNDYYSKLYKEKTCKRCGRVFKTTKDADICKICKNSIHNAERRKANPEYYRQKDRERRQRKKRNSI